MSRRMDKYEATDEIPKRSEKNQELYKQIYNAYDEFENLIVPSNAKEISPDDLKREITNRDEYRRAQEYGNITNNKVIRKEIVREEQKRENEIYDINELLDKAVLDNKKVVADEPKLSSESYLKKLHIDDVDVPKTNLEQVKEMYEEMHEESLNEEDELLKTANFSLEILSDLKGDDEATIVTAPIKEDDDDTLDFELELDNGNLKIDSNNDEENDEDFYSDNYKFDKSDFEEKDMDNIDSEDTDGGHNFFKIFLLVLGIVLVVGMILYLISYFKR